MKEVDEKISFNKLNNILFLPRNEIDNYRGNDRKICGSDDIKKNIINNGGVCMDTYSINNLDIQFNIVKNSNIIILDYGSSYFFNCIFLKNKKIIVLDNGWFESQTGNFISMKILSDIIQKNNKVVILNNNVSYEIIKIYL